MPKARAIVCRGLHNEGGWKIEEVESRALGENELLVRIVACGICHTDVMFADHPETCGAWPKVMGHEGAGFVEKIGANVKGVQPGDAVLLSFAACHECKMCKDGHLSHCVKNWPINFHGTETFSTTDPGQPDIRGTFFGQSSFASLTVVNATSVVNVTGLLSEEELKTFAPLGCGIQTGSGTVVNVAKAGPNDTIAIMGAGGVGLSAVMAAKISGCRKIIIIDRVDSRLELAQQLGATHAINTTDMQDLEAELVQKVRDLTDGYGTSITMDATGFLPLIRAGIEFTERCGQYVQVGSTKPTDQITLPTQDFMNTGKIFKGAIIGQVTPQKFIPKMIEWHRQGKFPFDKLIRHYPADDFMKAIGDMDSGEVVKPIIIW